MLTNVKKILWLSLIIFSLSSCNDDSDIKNNWISNWSETEQSISVWWEVHNLSSTEDNVSSIENKAPSEWPNINK
jgi:hypothetical protein